eukprot:Seg2307.5 transcript_id=Seg2307.5/GoldUCD/mRNA.D3Y31 product=Tenascin-R protein_id=Seg2307.5/GoldUCD/D3Y31
MSIRINEDKSNLCQLNNQTIGSKTGQAKPIKKQGWTYWSTDYNDVLVGHVCKARNPCSVNYWCKDTCECPGYECIRLYEDCKTAFDSGMSGKKILVINNTLSELPMFPVLCRLNRNKWGGSVSIQTRDNASMQFERNWNEYKIGFGNIGNSFWIGLDKLHTLAAPGRGAILMIAVRPISGNEAFRAVYSTFEVAGEADSYRLKVGGYEGNAGDFMSHLNGMPFSLPDKGNCDIRLGGWWHQECSRNINSEYPRKGNDDYQMRWAKYDVVYSRMVIKYND